MKDSPFSSQPQPHAAPDPLPALWPCKLHIQNTHEYALLNGPHISTSRPQNLRWAHHNHKRPWRVGEGRAAEQRKREGSRFLSGGQWGLTTPNLGNRSCAQVWPLNSGWTPRPRSPSGRRVGRGTWECPTQPPGSHYHPKGGARASGDQQQHGGTGCIPSQCLLAVSCRQLCLIPGLPRSLGAPHAAGAESLAAQPGDSRSRA